MIIPTEQLQWRKAKRCGGGACVEVATDGDQFFVRDSKHPEITPLRFSRAEWETFKTAWKTKDTMFGSSK